MFIIKYTRKLICLMVIGLMGITVSSAQSDTSLWEMRQSNYNGAPIDMYAYITGGDTLIAGKTFRELWKYQYGKDGDYYELEDIPYEIIDTTLMGYLYRDSLSMQVILKAKPPELCPTDLCMDSLITLYDFTKQVGDYVSYPCNANIPDSVVDVTPPGPNHYDSRKRRRFFISVGESNYTFQYGVYDGIGSQAGLFVRCFPEDNIGLERYCDDISDSCQYSGMLTGIRQATKPEIPRVNIYPNPVNDLLSIHAYELDNYAVRIYDITGSLKLEKPPVLNGTVQVNMADYATGVYLVEVVQEGKVIFREKVVKQ